MSPHILLVDDEVSLLHSMETALVTEGYRVSTALDGNSGLKILSKYENNATPISLIITDIHMPGMNGLAFVGEIRKLPRRIPILVITGFGDSKLILDLARMGIDGYLEKPIDVATLRGRIARILSERTSRP